ncbi:MAG: hypothetical protein BWY67_01295 [Bacteroidetes bacterium ADurb.Bin397]|nr:MAG: hypothetical protein BWY67_01295 [Bacteroidetes bacterium ADurb.Bin397]
MSRIWGGIHPPCDDIPGRLIAIEIAADAFSKAEGYFACCQANAPSTPGTIQAVGGNTKVCPGETKTYSVANVAGATSYTWIPPAGGVIVSGQGTTSIVVNYTSAFTAGDSLKVIANNSCAFSAPRSTLIRRNSPAVPGLISGTNFGLCNQSNVPYSVPTYAGVTHNWNITNASGSVVASGQGSNTITVNFSPSFVSGNLTVTANNGCGTSTVRKLALKATPAAPGTITGPVSVCANQQSVPYSIDPIANASAYVWTVPSGSRIFDGTTLSNSATMTTQSTSVFVNFKNTPGKVIVKGVNACGNGTAKNIAVSFGCREEADKVLGSEWSVSVFPNPSSDYFLVTLTDFEFFHAITPVIEVIDVLGRIVFTDSFTQNVYELSGGTLSPGIYTAIISVGNESKSLKIVKTE